MKKYLALILAFMMALSIAGCGNSAAPSTDNAAPSTVSSAPEASQSEQAPDNAGDSGDLPHITFYHGYFQDDWQPAVEMRSLYQEFAAVHADEFTFEAIALDTGNQGVYDKCIQEIALGSFPDIVDVSGMNIVPAAVEAGLALNLKSYIDADPNFKSGIGVNYEQNLYSDGGIYTVRDQLETIGFWYNEQLFAAAGADTPDKWQSWNDFDAAIDKLIASSDVATPFSMNQGWPTTILMSGHLLGSEEGRAFGKSVPDSFDNAAFKGTLDFLSQSALGKISNAFFTAADSESYREDFFNGKAAILFNGVWESGSFGDVAIDNTAIKPAVFPTQESGKTAAIVSASPGFVINSTIDQAKIDACIEFVKFMTSVDTAKFIFEKVQAMPPSTAIDYDAYINGDYDITVKALAEACKAASGADYQSSTAGAVWGEDIAGSIEGKYASIKDGSKTTDQIVSELDSILE